jgi:two-component system phosphate regulon response regulator OmpR
VPVSRDQISQAVYHRSCRIDDRSVDNLVVRLRRKLEEDPRHPQVLRSIRLIGYMFVGFQAPAQPVGGHQTNRQPERRLEESLA